MKEEEPEIGGDGTNNNTGNNYGGIIPDPIWSGSSSNICSDGMDGDNTDWRPYTYDPNLIMDRRSATTHKKTSIAPAPAHKKHERATMSLPGPTKSPPGHRKTSRMVTASATSAKAAVATAVATTTTIQKTSGTGTGNCNKQRKRTNTASASSRSKKRSAQTRQCATATIMPLNNNNNNNNNNKNNNNSADDNDAVGTGTHTKIKSRDPESENDDDSGTGDVRMTDTTMTHGENVLLDKQDTKWNEMYKRLQQYKNKHQSTNVPRKFDEDPRLGFWVNSQRQMHNKKKLAKKRFIRLNSIGFVWNTHEAQWTEMYDRLVEYKKQNKTTCVPQSFSADPPLGQWVIRQRSYYNTNQSCLTEDRITELNLIDFVWNKRDAQWMEMYEQLVTYKKKHGTTCIPRKNKTNPRLAEWVSNQRQTFKKKGKTKFAADRINRLNRINFVWEAHIER